MALDNNTLIVLGVGIAAYLFGRLAGGRPVDGARLDGIERKLDRVLARLGDGEPVVFGDFSLTEAEKNLLRQGQKIAAIKLVRERTGLGLKESKDLVEAAEPELRRG